MCSDLRNLNAIWTQLNAIWMQSERNLNAIDFTVRYLCPWSPKEHLQNRIVDIYACRSSRQQLLFFLQNGRKFWARTKIVVFPGYQVCICLLFTFVWYATYPSKKPYFAYLVGLIISKTQKVKYVHLAKPEQTCSGLRKSRIKLSLHPGGRLRMAWVSRKPRSCFHLEKWPQCRGQCSLLYLFSGLDQDSQVS